MGRADDRREQTTSRQAKAFYLNLNLLECIFCDVGPRLALQTLPIGTLSITSSLLDDWLSSKACFWRPPCSMQRLFIAMISPPRMRILFCSQNVVFRPRTCAVQGWPFFQTPSGSSGRRILLKRQTVHCKTLILNSGRTAPQADL